MTELVLAAADAAAIRTELVGWPTEKCAILYANQTARTDGSIRLLVHDIEWPLSSDYTRQGLLEAELTPELVARVTKRARRNGSSLVFVHSHPGLQAPTFSAIDWEGEQHLSDFLTRRHSSVFHIAVVISEGGIRARHIGTKEEVRIISVGPNRDVLFEPARLELPVPEQFDRQIRAFGLAGQQELQRLCIGIVGLGGVGSLVAQQLAHLGVKDIILIDPDVLEETNLNRVVNSTAADLGRPKVEIASRYIRSVIKDSNVTCIQGDVIDLHVAHELLNADVILGCTDSHGSRAVLQQISYQYVIPYIDMGVTIVVRDSLISHIYGRAQLLAPGLACFACDNLLDPNQVRQDMMTDFERQLDPYILGDREPAPAVISLNGTVASLSVTMLLAMVTGVPIVARHVLYNAMTSTMRSVRAQPAANCYVCSRLGSFARGNSWPLFAREHKDAD